MKTKALLTALTLTISSPLYAQSSSWFQFEAGIGSSLSEGSGDGLWVQYAVPHTENLNAPAALVGGVIHLYRSPSASWGIDSHVDAIYTSNISASCTCVPDANYNPHTHQVVGVVNPASLIGFYGSGHEWGIALTLEPYIMYRGWKIGVNGGLYEYHQSWSETIIQSSGLVSTLNHVPQWQTTWTAGISIGKGPWSFSYMYYPNSTRWNPYPGIVSRTHLLTVRYTF